MPGADYKEDLKMISYKPLWKTLIDKDKKKVDLTREAGISSKTINDMAHNDGNMYVSLKTLDRICEYLDCQIEDIVEYVPANQ